MFKTIVIVVCLAVFTLAGAVLYTHERKNLRRNAQDFNREPRLVLEDFVAYRMRGAELKSTWSARLAHLYEPNVVELYGDVHGTSNSKDGVDVINCESATAYFESNSILALSDNASLKRAEFKGFVEMTSKDTTLLTDYAEFTAVPRVLQSQRPVKVEGKKINFTGAEGFRYDLETENIDLFGQIKGNVRAALK